MQHLEEFLTSALARGDRLYLYSQADQRVYFLNEILLPVPARAAAAEEPPDDRLTARESQILTLVREGHDYRAIADALIVTVGTVKKTVHNVCRKMGVRSRWDLFRKG
ncbi:MAG: helix-turn-helix transcriptional regulator [Clostridia bacterium]|nr:helix-turn-helix transcriptional regulator [Clostridia bacterium]